MRTLAEDKWICVFGRRAPCDKKGKVVGQIIMLIVAANSVCAMVFTKGVRGGGSNVTPPESVLHQGQLVIFLGVAINVINGLT